MSKHMNIIICKVENKLYKIKTEDDKKAVAGNREKDKIKIKELDEGRLAFRVKDGLLNITGKKVDLYNNEKIEPDQDKTVEICKSPEINIRWTKEIGDSPERYSLPYDCQVHVGRLEKNDIIIADKYVSGYHLLIRSDNGDIRVEDQDSTNHTYLNGTIIKKALMKSGDVLDILYIRIRLENRELVFENVGDKLSFGDDLSLNETVYNVEDDFLVYHRSPRIRDRMPSEDIVLSRIPTKNKRYTAGHGRFSSLLSSGAMMGASMAMGAFSPAMLAMRAAMMVSPVSYMVSGSGKKARKKEKEQENERILKYSNYILAEKANIQAVADTQKDIVNKENPEPALCMDYSNNLKTKLWERCPEDSDFLQVRMGVGYENLCVNVKLPVDLKEFRMESDELEELSNYIIQETRLVDNVAARIDLFKYQTVGIVGTRSKVVNLVRNMIISMTALHYYKDVKIIGIFDKEEEELWSSVRWLPHVWDKDKQTRFINFDDVDPENLDPEKNEEDISFMEFCDKLTGILSSRDDKAFREMNKKDTPPLPHYIIILGSRKKTEHLELMKYLTLNDPMLGITSCFLYDKQSKLPKQCQFIVNVDDDYDEKTASAFYKDAGNEKLWFTVDPPVDDNDFDEFCRTQSAIEVDEIFEEGEIPSSLTFLQCLDAETPGKINLWENWNTYSPAKCVSAPIGKYEGNKVFFLEAPSRFKAHGLVAGMTGSGKSEMLLSWMLSIACKYHPRDLSFVIIDYKGGSMARIIERIPHVSGVITDTGDGIRRCFQSLQYEINRRKDILSKYNVKDIDDYMPKFHNGEFSDVLPRLMVVVDEFKELKKDQPEIMRMIDTIAAQGSALGVHLVLATQSPEDSVDEGTWKNTSFQICLRVKSAAASKAMIREPVAAFISQAGRAYVRVGTDESTEVFQLIQTAWSGAPYSENRKTGGYEVRLVLMNGDRIKTVEDNNTRFHADKTEIDAVCDHICDTAAGHGIQKNRSLWYEEIPPEFSFERFKLSGGFNDGEWKSADLEWLQIPVGLYDAPERQEQAVQFINFYKDGHYGVFGAPGKGKTTFLKTMVSSACTYYTPKDINIYIIDFTGWSMNIFKDFPHVGGVVTDGEEDKLFKLLSMMDNIIEERKKLFYEKGVDSLKSYRETISDDLPAILILINNFSLVLEQFANTEADFIKIIKQGITAGIYIVYTGNNNNGIKYKIYSSISGALVFELGDKSDYSGLVGQLGDKPLPHKPGRALLKQKSGQEDIQIAMFAEGMNDIERNNKIRETAANMCKAWSGNTAARIPVLPEHVSIDMFVSDYHDYTRIPIGYDCASIEPAYIDINRGNCIAVIGKSGSGKTKLLSTIVRFIKELYPDTETIVFDTKDERLKCLKDSGDYFTAYPADADETIDRIIEVLSERKKSGDDSSDQHLICMVIDDLEFLEEKMPEESQEKLDRIIRLSGGLNFLLFVGIKSEKISQLYNGDQLCRDIAASQSAVVLSGSAYQYEIIYSHNVSAEDRTTDLKPGFAYLYQNGDAKRIKIAEE